MAKRYSKKQNLNKNLKELLIIKKSLIPGAGRGAFAKKSLKKGKRLGEYNGKLLNAEDYDALHDKSYIFEVTKKFGKKYYLFYIDARSGDELRFVNGAHGEKQKKKVNVEAYQYAERIFFRTNKDINENEELLIDYGNNYWEE